jgi:PilZ domain
MARDLRRSPRIDVRTRLRAHLVTLDQPVSMRDFSLGGFSVESDEPLPSGTHIVRIQEGERWSVTVTAESRHRQSSDLDDGRVRHVMGFQYADQSPATQQTIRVLFERLSADQP